MLVTLSCLTLCDPWTVVHQAPLSMGFPRQEYWSGLPFPSPGIFHKGIKLASPVAPALAGRFLTTEPPRTPSLVYTVLKTRQEAPEGVPYAKLHIAKPRLHHGFCSPRNGIFNQLVRNHLISTNEMLCQSTPAGPSRKVALQRPTHALLSA